MSKVNYYLYALWNRFLIERIKYSIYLFKFALPIILFCSRINDLDDLPNLGIYLNDLNQHGLSKEMVLAGWQHGSRLELMFERAEQRASELEKNYEIVDTWKRRGDELLYSMMPQSVADVLRGGKSPLSTCEVTKIHII